MNDYLRYYQLETYLFDVVHRRFHETKGSLSAFDFFSIVVWKANRSKSRMARRLIAKDPQRRTDLNAVVRDLARSVYSARDHCERLRILIEDYGFRLPMASALLTVLWPEHFTVYDVRVCEQIGRHAELATRTKFDSIWSGYERFRSDVLSVEPTGLTLRDKDRYLWGRSSWEQLERDISTRFARLEKSA